MRDREQYKVALVEDNAHGLFASYKGKMLGTFGTLGTLSFHETKNIFAGRRGLLINDPQYIDRAEILREEGHQPKQVLSRPSLTNIPGRHWVEFPGLRIFSRRFCCAQLERRDEILCQTPARLESLSRQVAWLGSGERWWASPHSPPDCEPCCHMFYVLLPSLASRETLRATPEGSRHFECLPLFAAPSIVHGNQVRRRESACPVTECVS